MHRIRLEWRGIIASVPPMKRTLQPKHRGSNEGVRAALKDKSSRTAYRDHAKTSGAKIVDKSCPAPRSLEADTRRLKGRAFNRGKLEGELLARFFAEIGSISGHPDEALVWQVYEWLLVPFSLWPVDFVGLTRHLLDTLSAGGKLDAELRTLLRVIDAPPAEEAGEIMAAFERQIETGKYENLVKCLEKFSEHEARVRSDRALAAEWREIKDRFNVDEYRNAKGIIRRAFSKERNFRDLSFEWGEKKQRFRQVFDAFCHRWNLYGMEKDKPLIMKITVNPTPHGTMIFIPRCWSFDGRRDLAWKEISRLHKAHGAVRQGPKLSAARQEKQREKEDAKNWTAVAKTLGLRGDKLEAFVLRKLGKDLRTDRSYLRRLKDSS